MTMQTANFCFSDEMTPWELLPASVWIHRLAKQKSVVKLDTFLFKWAEILNTVSLYAIANWYSYIFIEAIFLKEQKETLGN